LVATIAGMYRADRGRARPARMLLLPSRAPDWLAFLMTDYRYLHL